MRKIPLSVFNALNACDDFDVQKLTDDNILRDVCTHPCQISKSILVKYGGTTQVFQLSTFFTLLLGTEKKPDLS